MLYDEDSGWFQNLIPSFYLKIHNLFLKITSWCRAFLYLSVSPESIQTYCASFFFFFAKGTSSGESCAKLSKLLLFTHSGNMKGRISQSVECSESDFGLESIAPAVWYLHSTYRHTWVSTHKKHSQMQETQIRKHTNTNRHIHTPPLFFYTHANTQSGNLPVHTQQYTFCLFVCLSLCEPARLLIHRSVHQLLWLLCPYIASSCFSPLPFLYPSCPAYHVPTVSLPINAHRAALQWGWRVPRQQAQYRVYRHACTCQPGRVRGGGGREKRKREGGRERAEENERRICWVRQTGRRSATLHIYTQPQVHGNVCTNEYETNMHVHLHDEAKCIDTHIHTRIKAHLYTHTHTNRNMQIATSSCLH